MILRTFFLTHALPCSEPRCAAPDHDAENARREAHPGQPSPQVFHTFLGFSKLCPQSRSSASPAQRGRTLSFFLFFCLTSRPRGAAQDNDAENARREAHPRQPSPQVFIHKRRISTFGSDPQRVWFLCVCSRRPHYRVLYSQQSGQAYAPTLLSVFSTALLFMLT